MKAVTANTFFIDGKGFKAQTYIANTIAFCRFGSGHAGFFTFFFASIRVFFTNITSVNVFKDISGFKTGLRINTFFATVSFRGAAVRIGTA